MARVVALVLGLAVVAWVAKTMLEGQTGAGSSGAASEPKRQLDQVRQKTSAVEEQAKKNVEDALRKANAQ